MGADQAHGALHRRSGRADHPGPADRHRQRRDARTATCSWPPRAPFRATSRSCSTPPAARPCTSSSATRAWATTSRRRSACGSPQPDGEVFVLHRRRQLPAAPDGAGDRAAGARQAHHRPSMSTTATSRSTAIRRTYVGHSLGNEFKIRSTAPRLIDDGEFIDVDYVKNAESVGARAWLARTDEEIRAALRAARAETRCAVDRRPRRPVPLAAGVRRLVGHRRRRGHQRSADPQARRRARARPNDQRLHY